MNDYIVTDNNSSILNKDYEPICKFLEDGDNKNMVEFLELNM